MKKKDFLGEDKELTREKKDNFVFFVERICFNNFFNMCTKTLNHIYFQTEGIVNGPRWVSNLGSLHFLDVLYF